AKIASVATFIFVPLAVLLPFLLRDIQLTLSQIPLVSNIAHYFPGSASPTEVADVVDSTAAEDAGGRSIFLKLSFPFMYIQRTFLLCLIIGSYVVYLVYNRRFDFFRKNQHLTLIIIMTISLVFLQYILLSYPVDPYIIYAIPMMAILGGSIVSILANNIKLEQGRSVLYSTFAIGLILTTVSVVPFAKPVTDTTIMRAERGAEAIAKHTDPDDKILSFLYTNGEVLLAERVIYPNTIHFPWSYQPRSSEDDCERYFKFNNKMVEDWLSGDADVVLISDDTYLHLSDPPNERYNEDLKSILARKLDENYILVETVEHNLSSSSSPIYNHNLEIYVKK
ncbi:hypothetical protein ACFLWV_03580, partial [Chloroflexota bacterium]